MRRKVLLYQYPLLLLREVPVELLYVLELLRPQLEDVDLLEVPRVEKQRQTSVYLMIELEIAVGYVDSGRERLLIAACSVRLKAII